MKNILITGGCGFIGSNFAKLLQNKGLKIFIVDKLTYAGNPENLTGINHIFYKNDIADSEISHILSHHNIDAVVNFAAETHVDNSIENPGIFIETNVNSTFKLVQNCLKYQQNKSDFRFIHISTDEVFGDLEFDDTIKFSETTPYNPSSPYSASKAAIDLIINSYIKTFNFNAIILHCTNNFGPNQLAEKLIPKTIKNCLENKQIPVYGTGGNIRDWIFVDDFCNGIYLSITKGRLGQHYCFGGKQEITNLEVVKNVCKIMSERLNRDCHKLINFVEDRKGHDKRYAVDFSKAKNELEFEPLVSFEAGISIIIDRLRF